MMGFTHPERVVAGITLVACFVLLLVWPGSRD